MALCRETEEGCPRIDRDREGKARRLSRADYPKTPQTAEELRLTEFDKNEDKAVDIVEIGSPLF